MEIIKIFSISQKKSDKKLIKINLLKNSKNKKNHEFIKKLQVLK